MSINRVEGDLEIRVELEDGVVSEAWSAGKMYRGFENILVGRAPLDGLVITPRICGICTTAHLYAAAKALDMIFRVKIPDNAKKVRNATLMVEHIQNDIRQTFLLFSSDFTRNHYRSHPLFNEAIRRYETVKGETVFQAIRETKQLIEIIAILGGQWPHSSFMVPGGVVSIPNTGEISQCLYLLRNFRKWYESRVLGCRLERWMAITTRSALFDWLEEKESHRQSDLGFFIRFSEEAGLETLGRGYDNHICFGLFDMPEQTEIKGTNGNTHFIPSGFFRGHEMEAFEQEKISEDICHSWFDDPEKNARHPFFGSTNPYATGTEGDKYSWAKAPRYDKLPAETGPLAEMIMSANPLFVDLTDKGANVFSRQLARIVRPVYLIPVLEAWLKEVSKSKGVFFKDHRKIDTGEGFGLIEAPRGALGHWVKLKKGKITKYQIITPTAWHASPKDSNKMRGPLEQAIIGTAVKDQQDPVEIEHVIRSFDPCLVCTVHAIDVREKR